MNLSPLDYLLIALAGWRLAYFITSERGPFRAAERLRTLAPLGGLTTCLKCASFWTAALCFVLWTTVLQPVVIVLALSAAGLMLASFSGVQHG